MQSGSGLGRRLHQWRIERALRRARVLPLCSPQVHAQPTQEFRGYLDLGSGLHYPLHLSCRATLSAEPDGDLLQPRCETLTPEALVEAVGEWYVQRYHYLPGHWTRPWGLRPVVLLRCQFQAQPAAAAQPVPALTQV